MIKNILKGFVFTLGTAAVISSFVPVTAFGASLPFKYLASTNECYAPTSREYIAITKNFQSFESLEDCAKMIKKPEPLKDETVTQVQPTTPSSQVSEIPRDEEKKETSTSSNPNGFNNTPNNIMFTINGGGQNNSTPRYVS
jgi:hypothetical protein